VLILAWALAVSLGALLYIYAGYPLLLRLIVFAKGPRYPRRGNGLPRVSLVISAYNEAKVIREKLENALALDYPRELLDIVVVSDASTDGTDEIVQEYSRQRVRLLRQEVRRGKTAGLNRVVPSLACDVVVFSDANAMYERSAIRMLVRNLADPTVGCVTGEARYLTGDTSTAAASERTYWGYEIRIKELETAVGSLVGGDGAIYAIRKELWRTLPDDAINDFLNPLQIVAAGWRNVFEPAAVCLEETSGSVGREWRRRVRIVSRSWRAVFQAHGVLNPFRVGLFPLCLLSHKVLRWFTGLFAAIALVSLAGLLASVSWSPAMFIAGCAVLLLAFAIPASRRVVRGAAYALVISAASLVGVVNGIRGRVSGVWTTARAAAPPA
jgi:cellulose synthase/poly-beta-1,6-N-acetylglucosamine synthase-like glycosyltransferase